MKIEPILFLFDMPYEYAGSILSVHIWAGIFVAMGVARGKWLIAENLQYMVYWYVVLGMIVNVSGNYLLIPYYGLLGAAWVTFFSQLCVAIIAPFLFKKTRYSSIMLIRSLYPMRWIYQTKLLFGNK